MNKMQIGRKKLSVIQCLIYMIRREKEKEKIRRKDIYAIKKNKKRRTNCSSYIHVSNTKFPISLQG